MRTWRSPPTPTSCRTHSRRSAANPALDQHARARMPARGPKIASRESLQRRDLMQSREVEPEKSLDRRQLLAALRALQARGVRGPPARRAATASTARSARRSTTSCSSPTACAPRSSTCARASGREGRTHKRIPQVERARRLGRLRQRRQRAARRHDRHTAELARVAGAVGKGDLTQVIDLEGKDIAAAGRLPAPRARDERHGRSSSPR